MKLSRVLFGCALVLPLRAMEVDFNPDSPESPLPKIGNFRLRTAQQPVSLFGTQQTIVDKGDILLFNGLVNNKGSLASKETVAGVLYGMTDNWSVLAAVPYALELKDQECQTSGIEDIILHTDVALWKRESSHSAQLWTGLSYALFPTGNPRLAPPTGFGAPTVAVATTFSHTTVKFYSALSLLGFFHMTHNNMRPGNQFTYEYAAGYNLGHPMCGTLVGLLEFNGIHLKKNKIDCKTDPLSGGNIIFLGPSLFWSFANVVLQVGIQFPLVHKLHNPQERYSYRTAFLINWVI